ncbi:hypothetical protein PVAND_013336 [Polypedilum vanderplanki]|uniref:Fibronectin type-III domain-containing protein n=1 Tax=Polypedilum vanderplanki TaxID=319348 RepID=A0A9J6CQD5_POLVA|nr:hypothetical protein PVAND_013336 [Polypedilum vanderplanki]
MIILIVVLLTQLICINAGTPIDCKAIDSTKFKDTFEFKYSGGQKGLKLNFDLTKNTFDHQGCKFEIKKMETRVYGSNSRKSVKIQNALNGLIACTEYTVFLKILNKQSKKEFEYENVVRTKPDNVETKINLSVKNVTENSVDLDWSTNSKGCLLSYGIIVKNKQDEIVKNITDVKGNPHTLTNLTLPGNFTVLVIGFDDKGSKISSNVANFRIIGDEIEESTTKYEHATTHQSEVKNSTTIRNEIESDYDENLEISLYVVNVDTKSVELKWNCSYDDMKDLVYHLMIHDSQRKLIFDKNISNDNSIIIKDVLEPCNLYNASVSVYDHTKSIEFTTKEMQPGNVTNFNFQSNETHSKISWMRPTENGDCVTNYKITCKGSFDNSISFTRIFTNKSTSYVFNKLPYSTEITFHVYANWSTLDSNQTSVLIKSFEHFDKNKFVVENVREFRLSVTEVHILWSFNSVYMTIFKEFQISVGNQQFNTTNHYINFEIDACVGKNYTVIIKCISMEGTAGKNVIYQTQLDDNDVQLSAINDRDIKVKQTDEKIIIEWKPNVKEKSCIGHYEVEYLNNVTIYEQPRMEIHKFISCVTYQIGITPVTKKGRAGKEKVFEFDTNVKALPKPLPLKLHSSSNQHLTFSVSINEEFKRCVMMKPTLIEVSCNDEINVERNITKVETDYKVIMNNLKPNTQYKCTAIIKTKNEKSEFSDAVVFETQQDSPQAPNNLKVSLLANNSIDVTWQANNLTGFADYYKIHVILHKTLFTIDDDCQKIFRNVTIIESSSEQEIISNLLPHSNYKIKILAVNKYGKGNFSEEAHFTTLPSKPTKPRDVKINYEHNEGNENLKAEITWKPPCFMNGIFTLYTIKINGHRNGLKNHVETKATSNPKLMIDDLKLGYNYEVEIQAVNQNNIYGDVLKHKFIAPSGIPLIEDLKDWTTLGKSDEKLNPDSIQVLMKRRIFVSSVGDITGIMFLIFSRNCHDLPQPQFGYLKNTSTQLPQAINGELNCTQFYQQTDLLQNPLDYNEEIELKKDLNVYNTSFTLGEGKCSKQLFKQSKNCNGPLKPNESYGLVARIFTKDAFRDTEPVYFETRNNFHIALIFQAIPVIVIGCVIIALLISLLTCVICCWMTRRQKKIKKKEKEAAEAAESLFSFTSYCVVDKNPIPKTQFDPLL